MLSYKLNGQERQGPLALWLMPWCSGVRLPGFMHFKPSLGLLYSCQVVSTSLISKGPQALITPRKRLVAKQRKTCLKGSFVARTFAWIASGTPSTSHQPKLGSSTSPSDPLTLCFQNLYLAQVTPLCDPG